MEKEIRFCDHWIKIIHEPVLNKYFLTITSDLDKTIIILNKKSFSSYSESAEYQEWLKKVESSTPQSFEILRRHYELVLSDLGGISDKFDCSIYSRIIECLKHQLETIMIPEYSLNKKLWKMHNNKPQIYTIENIEVDMSLNSEKKLCGIIKYRLRIGESAGSREEVYEDALKREFFESKSELLKSFDDGN